MPTKQRTQEIISLFQRYLKYGDTSLIEELSLKELETADTDLAWVSAKPTPSTKAH